MIEVILDVEDLAIGEKNTLTYNEMLYFRVLNCKTRTGSVLYEADIQFGYFCRNTNNTENMNAYSMIITKFIVISSEAL